MNYIINDTPLILLPTLAVKLGINEAIVLQQLHYRLNGSPLKEDGYTWYQHTYESWIKQLPFLSLTTIKRTFLKLEKSNYILSTKRFNHTNYDQRKWYRINYKLLYDDLGIQIDTISESTETDYESQLELFDGVNPSQYLIKEKKKKKENIASVIEYLNEKTGKKFKVTVQHEKLIQARMNEGNGFEDFKKVIDLKVKQWLHVPKMQEYLRPSTLFRPINFENYLNEQVQDEMKPKKRYKPIVLDFTAGEK